ncbi:hypothetical protein BKA00_007423 [Actinomadura coerulea]|uniref:Phage head morphogenesis domain-containing protein n=1 Tax=Actinomadura coerulea TaxID=46159 RepID=A0A7X0G6S5_9ACTN|nr:hypothetical protein [Actinomadura coerulea]MBB6400509.1 hypothetical protein [Actinomadura coerulea]GGQ07743.1 hypothetical protein GCM10010187_24750 [Actinomadura coerulea]
MAPITPTARMDKYRRDQAALGGKIETRAAVLVAARLNPANPDRGWASLLAELIAIIRGGRSVSEALAMEFYRYLREVEDAAGEPPDGPNVPFPMTPVVGSMIWTGPRLAKAKLRRGEKPPEIAASVGRAVGRSAMRHTLNGGRRVIQGAVEDDGSAWGWARVTDADPCDFCRMLATRGPVYKSARFAGRVDLHRYHDGCGCNVVPIFNAADRAGRRGLSA